jgi:hypothetical protein
VKPLTLLVIACAGGVVAASLLGLLMAIDCAGGDGGVPYVAEDSPRAEVCAATGDGLLVFLVAIGLLAGAAILAWRLLRTWAEGRQGFLPALGPLLAMPLTPVLLFAVLSAAAPSTCSDEQLAAVDEWRAGGELGAPPYECDHY